MPEVECPLEGCGYVGEPRSVEAHISGCRDDIHKGEVGRFHRDAIRAEEDSETVAEAEEEIDDVEGVDVEANDDRGEEAGAGAAALGATALGGPALAATAMEGSSGKIDSSSSEGLL
ncbi:hypothetical protein, partial [Haloferax volcanii]|uniref:hypothetical protein n=1 Tax=Haloferax volcanii TaxID=2246 RepID=UPI00385C0567